LDIEERRRKVLEWSSKGVRQSVIAKRLDVSVRTVEEDMRAIRGSMAATASGSPADVPTESFADTLAELEAECKKLLKDRKTGPRVKSSVLSTLTQIEKLKAERAPAGPGKVIYEVSWLPCPEEIYQAWRKVFLDAETPEEAWKIITAVRASEVCAKYLEHQARLRESEAEKSKGPEET